MALRGLDRYLDGLDRVLRGVQATDGDGATLTLQAGLLRVLERVLAVRTAGAKVLAVGNGGSSAIASHLANDLLKAVEVRALVLTEAALLTAYANDHSYEAAFEAQVRRWAEPADLLIAVSSSGRSSNILRAAGAARAAGASVVTLSGFGPDNPLRGLGEVNLYAPGHSYGHVELAHSVLAHYLTDAACDLIARPGACRITHSNGRRSCRPVAVRGSHRGVLEHDRSEPEPPRTDNPRRQFGSSSPTDS